VLGVSQSGFVITDCAMQGGDSGGPLLDMNGRVVGINSFCTPNLAVNVHGPIDAMLDQWTELLGGSVIETSSPDLNLMRILSAKSLSQSDSMREAFNSSVQGVDGSVVQVLVEDTVRVLGTAIAPDLIVTKYSELVASDVIGSRTCRQGEASWPYTILGHDLPSDLALLKLDGARLKPIVWHNETPLVGSFLASPGVENLPNGIGVLSAAPYQHTQPHIKFGAWFKNWFHGAPEIQSASDGGAARRAGLREGDVVVQLDDQRIENAQQLMSVLTERRVGDKVGVAVKREDQELRIDLTLGAYRGRERQGQEIVWGPLSDIRSGFETVLQHDTVLKPEQCGGPLIDLSGRAIGLNIARAGRVETLALPALEVQSLVASLLTASESAKPLNNDTPPTQSKADTVLMDLENRVLWTRPALEGTPRGHASSPVMKLANLGDEANRSGSETAIALQTFGTRGFVWREILYRRTRPTLLGRQTESPAGSHIRSEAR
ncbi:MAG: PDZ domain-containing protein, partial [Planctomycetota bacterium]